MRAGKKNWRIISSLRGSHPQKNTLLKNAAPVPAYREANTEGIFFKRVFFSPPQEELFITVAVPTAQHLFVWQSHQKIGKNQ